MIAVTGATGQLGRIVIEKLKGLVDASNIVAVVRNPEKAQDLGVEVRVADYDQPEALEKALEGIDKLLLISASVVGQRYPQHRNVVDAAKKAGVGYLAYTSLTRADSNPMRLAEEHKLTEEYIRESGIPFVFLRNGWYMENYVGQIDPALEHGAVVGSSGDGRVSAATREDYAEAAVAVLTSDGHEGAVYELGGDEAFTMNDFANLLSQQSGKKIVYRDVPEEEYAKILSGAGVPEGFADVLADSDVKIADGHLYVDSGDLSRLIGRPTTSLDDFLSASVPA